MNADVDAVRARRVRRLASFAVGAVAVSVAGAIALQTPGDDTVDGPEPAVSPVEVDDPPSIFGEGGLGWGGDTAMLDLGALADAHASSRLRYDECQQDYVEISGTSSSNRHAFYFC